MELTSENVKSEQLGHLGLISAVIRELGIIEKIDARIELSTEKGGIVSYGQRVAAMILNGLGFMNSRLYMTSHFFQDKPVAQLLGSELEAAHLNDDCLGRCLDKIAEYGVTKLYSELSFEIASEKKLLGRRLHLDSTSFVLHGRYENSPSEGCPHPEYGYSKAHRPDLKQVMLSLMQGGEANLPLWMEALDGNSSDKTSFHETVKRVKGFMDCLKQAPDNLCFVVDAAFYDAEKLKELDSVKWITRVPATITESKSWLKKSNHLLNWEEIDENYRSVSGIVCDRGLEQRWVMVHSKHAERRAKEAFNRRLERNYETIFKEIWHLGNKIFSCSEDADTAVKMVIKKLKYHQINYQIQAVVKSNKRGRPNASTEKIIKGYRIDYSIASELEKIQIHRETLGRFLLTTNQIEDTELSDAEVLKQYKEQSQVESGFKFIKNDAFELDSFFLNTPARIGALMMIMTLCLMVYNFAQYHLRKCLKENNDVVPNQHGKPAQNPTTKWISELMVVIAVVSIQTEQGKQRIVTNVNQVHRKIIAYFGKSALKIYGMPNDFQQVAIDYSNYKNLLNWCEM